MPRLPYPPSRVSDTVDLLHGESIPDSYRWLEDGASPEVRAWTDAQNALTAAYLESVVERPVIHARLERLLAIGALRVRPDALECRL